MAPIIGLGIPLLPILMGLPLRPNRSTSMPLRPESLSQHSLLNTVPTLKRCLAVPNLLLNIPTHLNLTKRHKPIAPPSTRDGTELQEGELYLDNLICDDDQWPKMVKWALTQKQRVKSANEVLEAERPKPRIKVKQEKVDGFSQMLRDRCPGIPANTITNLVKIFGASDLINGIVPAHLYRPPSIYEVHCWHHSSSGHGTLQSKTTFW